MFAHFIFPRYLIYANQVKDVKLTLFHRMIPYCLWPKGPTLRLGKAPSPYTQSSHPRRSHANSLPWNFLGWSWGGSCHYECAMRENRWNSKMLKSSIYFCKPPHELLLSHCVGTRAVRAEHVASQLPAHQENRNSGSRSALSRSVWEFGYRSRPITWSNFLQPFLWHLPFWTYLQMLAFFIQTLSSSSSHSGGQSLTQPSTAQSLNAQAWASSWTFDRVCRLSEEVCFLLFYSGVPTIIRMPTVQLCS